MRYFIGVILLLGLFSCKQETQEAMSGLDTLHKDYSLQPSAQSAKVYLDSLSSYLSRIDDGTAPVELLEKGVEVSMAQGLLNVAPVYLLPLIKDHSSHPKHVEHLIQLGDVMYALRIKHASNIIYDELGKQNLNHPDIQEKIALIEPIVSEQEDYMSYLFDQMTVDPDKTGINRDAALKYVDAAEAKALVAPNDPSTPNHLYGAAEVARSLRTFTKAMTLYDWILDKYPNSDKAPNVLFIKGFILEQDYQRDDEAKEVYEEFLIKYPDHTMAESAQFLLDNLGKSDEQILKEIEAKGSNK